jgi:hypothetical protein
MVHPRIGTSTHLNRLVGVRLAPSVFGTRPHTRPSVNILTSLLFNIFFPKIFITNTLTPQLL